VEDGLIVDTDILIDLLRKKDYAVSLIKRLEDEVELATSAINAFELYRGAYKSQSQEKNLASVKGLLNSLRMLNTDEDSMEIAGNITASLERNGNMIGIRDLLIASIALVNGFGVLTNNVRHFDRLIAFMQDGLIARTSNQCEKYYRQTDPGEIKHKYRTSRGILAYLAGKMAYWTAKFGPSLEHHVTWQRATRSCITNCPCGYPFHSG